MTSKQRADTREDDGVDWDAWIAERRAVFERGVSFNVHCGLVLEAAGRGWARMRMALRPEVMNPYGAAHGGSVATLIDSVAGTAVAAGTAPEDRIMGTIDMRVDYLERAAGSALVAEGRLVRAGKAIAVARVDVRDDRDCIVAIGTATYRLGEDWNRRNED
ncbi:MAG TPA: PaaI family thioesterase [Dehalococcoidia bacterium]|nr:PaaI family thioesterase [Dehalococcoidia bacterium]